MTIHNLLVRTSRKLANYLPRELRIRISSFVSKLLWLYPEEAFYYRNGILKYENEDVSGEKFLREVILKRFFSENSIHQPVIFDVGANTGEYACNLKQNFPDAKIYAFEPNPHAFLRLQESAKPLSITCENIGFGDKEQELDIYFSPDEKDTQHASLNKKVLTDIHSQEVESAKVHISVLSTFCREHNIEKINFLKIDTEGFEYMVLKGAEDLLNDSVIDIISFEFNEMNIYTGVFLKYFYDILPEYNLYRLDSNSLININTYKTKNEIFKFQNIVAFNKKLNISYECA